MGNWGGRSPLEFEQGATPTVAGMMAVEEYRLFRASGLKHHCIMGNDYDITNEYRMAPDGHTWPAGDVFGYDGSTHQYHDRYRLPVMHAETNMREGPNEDKAVQWLWKQWANMLRVRNDGVPTVGFT